jgi:NhaP-type Na+/H+ or K+/H+ antiporter
MKAIRRLHLYLGVFFAPLLLFFILTGWYQTINPERLKSPADAETLLQKLRTVHVDQIYPSDHELKHPSSAKLFKSLIVVMAIALVLTIALGVYLAFKSLRPRWPVWASLALGLVVPVAVLWLGRNR